ncbi:MAG TPA: hypothetical protein DCP90_08600 [Clostridiales bacterium]|nr:MAG: hypothetical protein A2Y22_05825 [Clostridiales bacterium GWD2_32_59]HAN10653.1 hypothetical protein [Clostridiales bacterium]
MNEFNFEYKRDMTRGQLVLKVESIYEIVEYQLKMLLNNKSKYLTPIIIKEEDIVKTLQYEITNKMSIKKYLSKNLLSKQEFLNIISQIIKCFKECKELLLDYHNLLLDMDKIYISHDGKELCMIYLPLKNIFKNNKEILVNVINKLVSNINKSESNVSEMVSKVVMYVNNDSFNIFEFEKMLNEFENKTEKSGGEEYYEKAVDEEADTFRMSTNTSFMEKLKTAQGVTVQIIFMLVIGVVGIWLMQTGILLENIDKFIGGIVIGLVVNYLLVDKIDINKEKKMINTNEDVECMSNATNICEEDKTVVLESFACLKSIDGANEDVIINKPKIIIGKNKEQVDYYIDNATISREHAEIVETNGVYGIRDLKSSNGTYVNDEEITSGQTRKLVNGDTITLSNQSFKFVCKEE